jgi:hypothetical protein
MRSEDEFWYSTVKASNRIDGEKVKRGEDRKRKDNLEIQFERENIFFE